MPLSGVKSILFGISKMHMVAEYSLFEMFDYCKGRQGTEGGEEKRTRGEEVPLREKEETPSVGAGAAQALRS